MGNRIVPSDLSIGNAIDAGVPLVLKRQQYKLVLGSANISVSRFASVMLRESPAQRLLVRAVADTRITAVIEGKKLHGVMPTSQPQERAGPCHHLAADWLRIPRSVYLL